MRQKEFNFEPKVFIVDSLTNVNLYDIKDINLKKIFSRWQETKYKIYSSYWENLKKEKDETKRI